MNFETMKAPAPALLITSVLLAIAACGDKKPEVPPTPTADAAAPAGGAAGAAPATEALTADSTTWSPEALEDLLAPVALYPDPVLAQVFVAVTNPQEVLDAGNWLIANPDLKGKALDTAAEKAGFTLNMRSVMQFPEVVDKLCMNMPWTEELGQAYVNDQQGVMDAVQRLRAQAQDVGTLKSSPQMKVSTQKDPEGDVIMLEPANPNVVAVPQYDPVVIYAPQTVVAAPAPVAPAATTTTTTTTTEDDDDDDDGHSTGSLVTTGLLAFGAGLLVSEVFDDDDDYYNNGYYGNMYHGGMPYYPPAPYRPAYGGGHYPGNSYNRPNNYVRGGNTVIVNQNNNYYDRYNSDNGARQARNSPQSPITKAKPGRNDLNQLNAKSKQGPERRAPSTSEALNGKGGYAGNNPQVKQTMDRQATKGAATAKQNASGSRVQGSYAGAKPGAAPAARTASTTRAPAPKVQGGYAGAKPDRPAQSSAAARPAQQASAPRPATQQANRANTDRGYASNAGPTASRAPTAQRQAAPTAAPRAAQAQQVNRPPPQASRSAVSSGGGGGADRAASSRGHKSMPSGGASKSRSSSGGSKQKRR